MHGDRPLSVAAAAGLVLVWLAVQVTPAGGFLSRKLQFHPGVGKRLASTADSQQTISAPLHESNSSLRTQPPNAPIEMTGGLSSERTVGHISARGSQVLNILESNVCLEC